MSEINMKEYWDNRAQKWIEDHHKTSDLKYKDYILSRIDKSCPINSIVELGVGNGRWVTELSKRCNNYMGIDISKDLVDYCKKTYPDKNFLISDIEIDAPKLIADLLFSYTTWIHVRPSQFNNTISKLYEANLGNKFVFVETVQGPHFYVNYVFRHPYVIVLPVKRYEEIDGDLAIIEGSFVKREPKLSVVIVNNNRAEFLRDSIDSILNQTFRNFELIIVDDASVDNSKEIIDEYVASDNRVRGFYINKNRGVGAARNFGNSIAKSPIIVVQDSDDVSIKYRLQHIYDAFQKYNCDIFSSSYTITNDRLESQENVPCASQTLEELMQRQLIGHPTMAYLKVCWERCVYPEEMADVDYGLLIKMTKANYKFYASENSLVYYRQHGKQISRRHNQLQQQLAKSKRLDHSNINPEE